MYTLKIRLIFYYGASNCFILRFLQENKSYILSKMASKLQNWGFLYFMYNLHHINLSVVLHRGLIGTQINLLSRPQDDDSIFTPKIRCIINWLLTFVFASNAHILEVFTPLQI